MHYAKLDVRTSCSWVVIVAQPRSKCGSGLLHFVFCGGLNVLGFVLIFLRGFVSLWFHMKPICALYLGSWPVVTTEFRRRPRQIVREWEGLLERTVFSARQTQQVKVTGLTNPSNGLKSALTSLMV